MELQMLLVHCNNLFTSIPGNMFCFTIYSCVVYAGSRILDFGFQLESYRLGKKVSKAPKIQRLATPLTLQRKLTRIAEKKKRITKAKAEAAEYQKLLAMRLKEQRERGCESLAKRRSKLSAASKPSVVA
ncbi:40S ribosomal protein S6-like [Gossypium raimondii]|uniref:40S ribosomal protein S6-like n=1 Tax=Gossypium raimondii TaxID=29730 RepID=UPI00227C2C16|nr:40S ribosomal protein S6-like [Gossypium raimondii]